MNADILLLTLLGAMLVHANPGKEKRGGRSGKMGDDGMRRGGEGGKEESEGVGGSEEGEGGENTEGSEEERERWEVNRMGVGDGREGER